MGNDALLLNIQTGLAAQLHHNAKIVSKREASRQQTNVTVKDSSKLSYVHQRRMRGFHIGFPTHSLHAYH